MVGRWEQGYTVEIKVTTTQEWELTFDSPRNPTLADYKALFSHLPDEVYSKAKDVRVFFDRGGDLADSKPRLIAIWKK